MNMHGHGTIDNLRTSVDVLSVVIISLILILAMH